MTVPIVKRIAQWDWQGKLVDDPIMCASSSEQGKPMNGGRCPFVARYQVADMPMCVRHAQKAVFEAVLNQCTGEGSNG